MHIYLFEKLTLSIGWLLDIGEHESAIRVTLPLSAAVST